MKKEKGFTLVEVIVSFSLMSVVMIYLLKTIAVISTEQTNILTLENYSVYESTVLKKIYKDINNILDDIGFQGDDRILCKSIIESLEKEASINIRKDKCVAIPHIGTIQKNWYRSKLISHYKDFKEARKTMTREEYKEYTAKVMEEEKQKHYEEEEKIKTELKFKKKLLPIWIKLSKKHNAAYANLWLYAMSQLEIIEFDEEVEEIYERFGIGLDADHR